MARRFSRFPKALERPKEVAERYKFDLPLGVAQMAKVPLPDGMTQAHYLRQKAEAGALQIYGKITLEIQKRLDHELELIARLGYEPIFHDQEDGLSDFTICATRLLP
jgi:DNA polymerase-3 subunit alpha